MASLGQSLLSRLAPEVRERGLVKKKAIWKFQLGKVWAGSRQSEGIMRFSFAEFISGVCFFLGVGMGF